MRENRGGENSSYIGEYSTLVHGIAAAAVADDEDDDDVDDDEDDDARMQKELVTFFHLVPKT